jgi:hypothetical protein
MWQDCLSMTFIVVWLGMLCQALLGVKLGKTTAKQMPYFHGHGHLQIMLFSFTSIRSLIECSPHTITTFAKR